MDRFCKMSPKFLITICTPLLLSLIPLSWGGVTGKEPYAAFVICLMAIYWMSECIPLAVTAFIPIILFPAFDILSTDRVTSSYLQDSLLFLFGGIIIALSFEYSNLHSRLALKVILLVGPKTSQLLFGMMGTTMFLSMWMNNTSTTAMMVPIVNAVMAELHKKMLEGVRNEQKDEEEEEGTEMEPLRANISSAALKEFENGIDSHLRGHRKSIGEQEREVESKIKNIRTMFLLGTAYASNIGGTGVITGSSTNVIALDLIRKDADEIYTPDGCKQFLNISFVDWMVFNVPPMILNTFLTWAYLQIHFLGLPKKLKFWRAVSTSSLAKKNEASNKSVERGIKRAIGEKYKALGPIRFHEIGVLILFLAVVGLWVFKDPQIFPGWDSWFPTTKNGKSFIKEATPTLLIAFLMFILPSKWTYFTNLTSGGLGKGIQDPLLSWDFVKEKFPWGIFMLLGGGSAMALGSKEAGLNKWLGGVLERSETLQKCPDELLLLLILFFIAMLTTVASNTACAAIVTPVLLGISYVKDIHPLYLVLAATTVCSYAFILPVSTPPNAIVYSSTDISIKDMAVPGLFVNLISILILFLTTNTSSVYLLGFNNYNHECENMTLLATRAQH